MTSIDEQITLQPCPFCGGEAEFGEVPYERKYAGDNDCRINHDHGGQFIQCKNTDCSASSMLIFPTMADAKPLLIEKWNKRATLESIRDAELPVEPEIYLHFNGDHEDSHHCVKKSDYDSLQSALKLAQDERDNEKEVRNCISRAYEAEQKRAEKAEATLIQHYCDYEFTPTLEQAAEMMLEERKQKKATEAENAALREDAASLAKAKEIFKHMAFRENWSGDDISIKRTENSGEKIGIFLYSWGRSPWMVAREFLDEIDTAIFNAIDSARAE